MQRTPSTLLTAVAAMALVGTAFTGTAAATGKTEAPGQAKKAEAAAPETKTETKADKAEKDPKVERSSITEDTDSNDGGTPNNVADEGDNRHPSGKDRSVEHGGSGNQGRSTSDPDDDGRGPDRSNGGADKPDGPGGLDKADQDGNNGCGNDDDFEDDNEGWCGRKPKPEKPAEVPTPAPNPPVEQAETPRGEGSTGKPGKPCPAGMVDTNGTKPGGCVKKPAPTPTTVATPNPDADGEVRSSAAGAGLPDVCVLAALTGAQPMPEGCADEAGVEPAVLSGSLTAEPTAPTGEVRSAELTASAPGEVSARSAGVRAATGGVLGALAFTGVDALTLLVAAALAIAAGIALVRMDRRRKA